MKRDFAELNPQEVLWVAVGIEERNARIYEHFATLFHDYDPETVRIFEEMAAEEHQHQKLLEERYRERYGDAALDLRPEDIRQPVELPTMTEGELLAEEGLSFRHALEVGLRAEREAREFYLQLAASASDPALLALYGELADTESDHEIRLANKILEFAVQA